MTKETKKEVLPGLTQEAIDEFKREYPYNRIFSTVVNGETYVLRDLLVGEHHILLDKAIKNKYTAAEQDKFVVNSLLLYPEVSHQEWLLKPAGVIPSLMTAVKIKSLFPDTLPSLHVSPVGEPDVEVKPDEDIVRNARASVDRGLMMSWTTISGRHFIMKGITRLQFKGIQDISNSEEDMNEALVRTSLVWPDIEIMDLPAGIISLLVNEVTRLSGFAESVETFDL